MIKIAHIQLLPLLSGVQRVCLDELQRLDPKKYKRFLICSYPGPLTEEAEKYGIECIYIKKLQREINLSNDIMALINLFRVFKRYKFDIVHTHSSKPGVLGRIAAKLASVKFILHTVHGFSFPTAKNKVEYYLFWILEKIGAICGDLTLCLHEEDAKIAARKLWISTHKIKIIANGVDLNKFIKFSDDKRISIRDQLINVGKDDVVIGMIGRLWPQKNPLFLVKVFSRLVKENNSLKLCIVGDGELKKEIECFIKQEGIESNVSLMGWRNDVNEMLNLFDVFVLPSLWEGMPLAILEAKSASLPCVVSNIAGNKTIINNNVDGFCFELDRTGDDLKDKLSILVNDLSKRKSFGEFARSDIVLHHDIDVRIDEINSLYVKQLHDNDV